jgi:hypothetical protein
LLEAAAQTQRPLVTLRRLLDDEAPDTNELKEAVRNVHAALSKIDNLAAVLIKAGEAINDQLRDDLIAAWPRGGR